MRKFLLGSVLIVIAVIIGGYIFYKSYLPNMIADAIVMNETPAYIPKRIMNRVDEIRGPINKSAEGIIRELDRHEIGIDAALKAVEKTTEDDVNAVWQQFNEEKPTTGDEVFDIIKPHIHSDFDVELLRKPFVQNFDLNGFRRAMNYAAINKTTRDVDIETTRAIARQILLKKYQELHQ